MNFKRRWKERSFKKLLQKSSQQEPKKQNSCSPESMTRSQAVRRIVEYGVLADEENKHEIAAGLLAFATFVRDKEGPPTLFFITPKDLVWIEIDDE